MACEVCPVAEAHDDKLALCTKALAIYNQRVSTSRGAKASESIVGRLVDIQDTLGAAVESAGNTPCTERSILGLGLCPRELILNYAFDKARQVDPGFDGVL